MKVGAVPCDWQNFRRLLSLNPNRDLRRSDNPKVYEKSKTLVGFQEKNAVLPAATVIETQGLILQLLSRFLACDRYSAARNELIPSRIMGSIDYIQTHLATGMTVKHLAEKANLSVDHYSRCFYRHVGLRPIEYIHRKRIERAQFLILTTDLSLSAIGEETGFDSLSYFTRIFRSVTGQPPGTYKKTHSRYV